MKKNEGEHILEQLIKQGLLESSKDKEKLTRLVEEELEADSDSDEWRTMESEAFSFF